MKKLWIAAAIVLALILGLVLAVPFLVDADRYRGLVEARIEKALGRDVRLGPMKLSLFPAVALAVQDVGIAALPEEGGGDLLTARSLRVGVRFVPLLKKRLEISSLTLEEPSMVLARDAGGNWNVERLVVRDPGEEPAEPAAADDDRQLTLDRLRVSGGTLTYRDAFEKPGTPVELVLDDLDLRLDGLGSERLLTFDVKTSFASAPGTRLAASGTGGPFGGESEEPLELHADVELEAMPGGLLTELAAAAGVGLDGAVGERPFDAEARIDMADGTLTLGRLVVEGADLEIRRNRGGQLNVTFPEDDEEGAPAETTFAVRDVRIRGVRLRVYDAALGGKPLDVVFDGVEAELDRWPFAEPASFRLSAAIEGGGGLEASGSARPAASDSLDLAMDFRFQGLPGSLIARLASAGGADLGDAVGSRPVDAEARLEIQGGATAVTGLELRGAELDLRRDRQGRWNFRLPEDGGETASRSDLAVRDLVLAGIRVRVRDATVGERPFDAVFEDLRLELDRLPTDGPADFRLTAGVGGGTLEVSGRAGASGGDEMPVRVDVKVGNLALAVVQPMLEVLAGEGEGDGRADLEIAAEGTFPSRLETRGTARVAGAKVTVGEGAGERLLDLDFGARFDAVVSRGGELFDVRNLDVDLEGSTLSLRGTVAREGDALRWDMALAPTRLPADELQALMALFLGEMDFTFSAGQPIAIEARVQGSTAGGDSAEVSGRVQVDDLRLTHPSLSRPLERVHADAQFRGDTVEIRELSARVGSNDLAGEMTVKGFEAPRLAFDLRAERADVGELLSLAADDEAPAAPGEESFLETVFAEGDLRVRSGTWDTLELADLDAHLRLENGVATLDPASMKLYDGSFRGRVVADLRQEPTTFEIRGNADRIDVDPFLASNLNLGDLLFGRFTGELEARGAGSDYETILRSLEGRGTARVVEGRLGRTNVLKAVSKVAGVLGQRSLASLANRLASESTRFERLEGRFRLTGGTMRFEELLLDSPDFALRGQGLADLLSSALDGEFRIAFSRELSELMRLDDSRAAEVFWDPQAGKVAMPLALKGSLSSPTATVDWGSAVEGYARRRATEGLADLLGKALGVEEREQERSPPPPAAAPAPLAEARDGDLRAEITGARWGGSILFQDLKLSGVVRGHGVARASLEVVDAGGAAIERRDRLSEVDNYVASVDPAAYVEIGWQARIDGKDLALARFPLSVRLTVYGRGGERAEATLTVEK